MSENFELWHRGRILHAVDPGDGGLEVEAEVARLRLEDDLRQLDAPCDDATCGD